MIIEDIKEESYIEENFDVGIWAAGYEARSSWLIRSKFKPKNVNKWYRVEFEEHRDALHAPETLKVSVGELVGGKSGKRYWDGYWRKQWQKLLSEKYLEFDRKIKLFIDYSSMPRTVYGTLLIEALRGSSKFVDSIVVAYVPGIYRQDWDGSRRLLNLRALIGLEGQKEDYLRRAAFIIGLGYDGLLAESVLDLYQVERYSCFLAEPGVTRDAGNRSRRVNEHVLSSSELIGTANVRSVNQTFHTILKLCSWYLDRWAVVLVPIGPKTHVLAAITAAVERPEIAFRWITTSWERPIEVTVSRHAVPCVTRISSES